MYLLLPSGLLSPFTDQTQMRTAVRILIPFLVVVFSFAPSLLGFFMGDDRLSAAEHAGYPRYLILFSWNRGFTRESYWMLLLVLLAIAALFNTPRLWVAVREVAAASRERVRRDTLHAEREAQEHGEAPDAVAGA